jgi:Astacin (Peptidase family M12A)
MSTPLVCTPKSLPLHKQVAAARRAIELNPNNQPHPHLVSRALAGGPGGPARLALLVGRRWPTAGVSLTVKFLDGPPADLRARLLLHMNAWGKTANVQFRETNGQGQVRVARLHSPPEMAGFWSYVGTEILDAPADEPTMNFEDFTMEMPESEFHRVVRHEAGHTLGFVHEHMRRELVNKIDVEKAIAFFGKTQGWTPDEVRAQVLTPIEESSLLGTAHADPRSIMCYQIPGSITKNGKPIIGGTDIDKRDFAMAASFYPQQVHALKKVQTTIKRTQKRKSRRS